MFCPPAIRFSAFFSVRQIYHSLYCSITYSPLLISMGRAKSTTPHASIHSTKRTLCLLKKKKASPTMPYSFTSVPSTMSRAAVPSRSFSIHTNVPMTMAATAMLNWLINRAVSSSWAQYHSIIICCPCRTGNLRMLTNSTSAIATCQNSSPKGWGSTAKGAITMLNSGP